MKKLRLLLLVGPILAFACERKPQPTQAFFEVENASDSSLTDSMSVGIVTNSNYYGYGSPFVTKQVQKGTALVTFDSDGRNSYYPYVTPVAGVTQIQQTGDGYVHSGTYNKFKYVFANNAQLFMYSNNTSYVNQDLDVKYSLVPVNIDYTAPEYNRHFYYNSWQNVSNGLDDLLVHDLVAIDYILTVYVRVNYSNEFHVTTDTIQLNPNGPTNYTIDI